MRMLPRLQAERQLAAIEAASLPHMTDASRKRVLDRLIQRATRRSERHRARTAGEAFASLPIPVVIEPGTEVNDGSRG